MDTSTEITKIEQYWCWRRIVSMVLLVTFPATLLTPTLAYSNQDIHTKIQTTTEFNTNPKPKTKSQTNKKVAALGKETPTRNNLIATPADSNQAIKNKPIQNYSDSPIILLKHNKYQPYFEIGGAKYFNQKSKVAGIYDLFITLLQTDDQLFFTDLRFFDRSGNSSEGNFHLGYRKLFPNSSKMLGIYGAFDLKKSEHGNTYNQIMFGAEYWQSKWFIGVNIYKPLGATSNLFKEESLPIKTPSSRGISSTKHYEKALAGGDAEIGYAFTDSFTLYGGGYYFHADDTGTTAGPKTRVTYNYNKPMGRILGVLDGISVEAGAQYDKKRRATAYIGIKLKVGLTNQEKNSNLLGFERHMAELVRRDPDIVIGEAKQHEKFYQPGEHGFQEGDKSGDNSEQKKEEGKDNKNKQDNKSNQDKKENNKDEENVDFRTWDIKKLLNEFNLPSDATEADVKKRYRELMLEHHPDKGGTNEVAVRFNGIKDAIDYKKHLLAKENTWAKDSNFASSSSSTKAPPFETKTSQGDNYKKPSTATNESNNDLFQPRDQEQKAQVDLTHEHNAKANENFSSAGHNTEDKDNSTLESQYSHFFGIIKEESSNELQKLDIKIVPQELSPNVCPPEDTAIKEESENISYLSTDKNETQVTKLNLIPETIDDGCIEQKELLLIKHSDNDLNVANQNWLIGFFDVGKSLITAPIYWIDQGFNTIFNMFMPVGTNAEVIKADYTLEASIVEEEDNAEIEILNASNEISKIEQRAREQLNKNGRLDLELIKIIFDSYAKDPDSFSGLIREILAQDKNIPIIELNKLVPLLTLIEDKHLALFMASRLLLKKVKLPDEVTNHFIDYLELNDNVIILRAIDVIYQLDQELSKKTKKRFIDAIISLLPKIKGSHYYKLTEVLDKLELTKEQKLRREVQELIADWYKAATVAEKKALNLDIIEKVTSVTAKDILEFYKSNLNAQHYELYAIAREALADLNKYESLFWNENEQELNRIYAGWKNSPKKCYFDDSINDLSCLAVKNGVILLTKKQKKKLDKLFDDYPWLEDELSKIEFTSHEEISNLVDLVLEHDLRHDEISEAITRYSWQPNFNNICLGLIYGLLEEFEEEISTSDKDVLKTSIEQLINRFNWSADIIFSFLKKITKKALPEFIAILEVLADYDIEPSFLNREGLSSAEILDKYLGLEKSSEESGGYLDFAKLLSKVWNYRYLLPRNQALKKAYEEVNLLIRDHYFYLDKDSEALLKEFYAKNRNNNNKELQTLIANDYFKQQLQEVKNATAILSQSKYKIVGGVPKSYKKDEIYIYRKTETIKEKDKTETKEQINICLAGSIKKVCFNKESGSKEEKENFARLEAIMEDTDIVDELFICRIAAKKGLISNAYKCLPLPLWEETDFKEWRQNVKKVTQQNLAEVIAVLSQAAHNTILKDEGAYPREAQILALLSLLKSSKGGLAQISTGEGKSLIIAMFATIKVINGRKVDITTSSQELAKRELNPELSKTPDFFHTFDITVSHNIDENSGPKECYQSDVVYGDLTHFIGDNLKDLTRNVKMGRGTDLLIVDEVDNMFIDEIKMLVQLSWPMPGFALLNQLFVYMWGMATSSIQYLENKDNKWHIKVPFPKNETLAETVENIDLKKLEHGTEDNYLFEVGNDLREFLEGLVTNYTSEVLFGFNHGREYRKVVVPSQLENFAKEQLPIWAESLVDSYAIKNKGQYLIHVDPNSILSKNATIVAPVDYANTGTIQTNMHWGNGLHQFLQIANGVTIQPETLISIFMSYVEFFNKYKGSIYGVTGTLGDEPHQEFLKLVYDIETSIIPNFAPKDFKEFKSIITKDKVDWYEAIIDIVMRKIKDKRPCLIIFELMEDVEKLRDILIELGYPKKQIFTYGVGGGDESKIFGDYKLRIGDIVIATNMAGRGTDLKISREALKNGGLHLIMTIFSKSLRVERQAFGRPARKGEPGSGQLVIFIDPTEPFVFEDPVDPCKDIYCFKNNRDKLEMQTLKNDRLVKVPAMKIKDQLFSAYVEFMRQIDTTTSYKVKIGKPDSTNTTLYLYLNGNEIFLNNIKITEVLGRLGADLRIRINNILQRPEATIADLNKYDYEAILFVAAENGYLDTSDFSNSVQTDYYKLISDSFSDKDKHRLRYFGEKSVTDKFWNDFYSSSTTKRKFLLWFANREQFGKKEEVNQLDEDWGIWLRKQDDVFQEIQSLNNRELNFDKLNAEREQLKGKLYKEFEIFKEQELLRFNQGFNQGGLIVNPAYYVNKADRYFFRQNFYEDDPLLNKFLAEALWFIERALELDNYYTWAAKSIKSSIHLYQGSTEVKRMEENDDDYEDKVKRAYEVKKLFYDESVAVIKNIREVYIPIEEGQLFSLSSLKLLNYTDQSAMQFIGTIAIYNEIIKVEQDNLKLIAEAKEDEAIEIDTFVKISDLADTINIAQEIANVYKSSNTTGIEFKNKKLILEQIEAAGVNELPKIKVYKLEDNRSYFGNFLGIILGIASIFTGCWMLGAFTGIFATSFATSLVLGGVGEILTYSYVLIKGQPIGFKDVLSSKGMSLGISLATAGTLFLLDKVPFIHNLMGPNFVGNMADAGRKVGLAFAIQATTMAATGLLYDFGRKLIDLDAIKKDAREAIKRIIEICKEKLRRIFATDFFNDMPELIGTLYKKIEAIVAGYMERFNGEGAVFGRGVATSTASNLITGLPYLGNIISAGTGVITNSIKNSEAISEISEETMKAILETNNNAMKTGEMLAKRLPNDFGKEESEEIVLAIKEQKYMVGGEIDYNDCGKLDNLNLRKELLPRKPGIVEECIYVQEVMTRDYKEDFGILEDRFVEIVASAKQNIQKEIIESTASVPGGILGQHFGETIYKYAEDKLEELKAKNKNKEPQFSEGGPGPKPEEKQKPKEEKKGKPKADKKSDKETQKEPKSETPKDSKEEPNSKPKAQAPKDTEDKQAKGNCIDGACAHDSYGPEIFNDLLKDFKFDFSNVDYDDAYWAAYEIDKLPREKVEATRQYQTIEELRVLMGPNAGVYGIRPLDPDGNGPLGPEDNFMASSEYQRKHGLEYAHSHFFYTDNEGELHDLGFMSKERGVNIDLFLYDSQGKEYKSDGSIKEYRFEPIKRGLPPEVTNDPEKMRRVLEGTVEHKEYQWFFRNCHYSKQNNPFYFHTPEFRNVETDKRDKT